MVYLESGPYCDFFERFLDNDLVNQICPRSIYDGCFAACKGERTCPHTSYALLVDGVRMK